MDHAVYAHLSAHSLHVMYPLQKVISGFDMTHLVCYSLHEIAPESASGRVDSSMAELLTTNQVQELLSVDRTTIYRMAQGGQLPAIRVGKQWRFDQAEIERWLRLQTGAGAAPGPATPAPSPAGAGSTLAHLLPLESVQLIQDALAVALGVMMVLTDMDGHPVTRVSNSCGLFDIVIGDAEAAARCIQGWQRMAGGLTMEPKFAPSDLGLLCTRGLIRSGNELKGMVFLGGIAPDEWPPAPDQVEAIADHYGLDSERVRNSIQAVHRLDRPDRERALGFVQRMADICSHMLEDWSGLHRRLQAIASLTEL
jgi:excisionase family DNA binding protein